jgi:hypothetical protein
MYPPASGTEVRNRWIPIRAFEMNIDAMLIRTIADRLVTHNTRRRLLVPPRHAVQLYRFIRLALQPLFYIVYSVHNHRSTLWRK